MNPNKAPKVWSSAAAQERGGQGQLAKWRRERAWLLCWGTSRAVPETPFPLVLPWTKPEGLGCAGIRPPSLPVRSTYPTPGESFPPGDTRLPVDAVLPRHPEKHPVDPVLLLP